MSHFKPFRERNPVVVGAVSLVVLAMVMVAALRADDLPVIGGGDTYHAMFTEAGGLKVNDEVRIAGVRVGKVDDIELDGDQVKVSFKVDDAADFGPDDPGRDQGQDDPRLDVPRARAGRRPASSKEGGTIPVERTVLAVRRGRGLRGPRLDVGEDRHRPARRVADHARRPHPQHPRGVPRRARRR